jgi:hypothetical protein
VRHRCLGARTPCGVTGVRAHNPHLNGGLSVDVKDQQRKAKQSWWTSRGVCDWAVVPRTTTTPRPSPIRRLSKLATNRMIVAKLAMVCQGKRGGPWPSAHQLPRCQVPPGSIEAGELGPGARQRSLGPHALELADPARPECPYSSSSAVQRLRRAARCAHGVAAAIL